MENGKELTQQEQMEAAVALSSLTNVLAKKCSFQTMLYSACVDSKGDCNTEKEKLQFCTKEVYYYPCLNNG